MPMPKLPLTPAIFSAAHISKWDALPEDAFTSGVQTGGRSKATISTQSITIGPAGFMLCCPRAADESHGYNSLKFSPDALFLSFVFLCGSENMAVKTYTWIMLWFLLTTPVILWDAAYCFMRPRSMVGGDLHWIWEPYGIYQDIDYVYGTKALEQNNGFTNAQALLNLVETALNLAYIYLAHASSWSGAPLVGFTAATMTFSKTMLYWAQEYYCGGCAVGHNAWGDLLLYWVLPNGLWLVFPCMIAWRLGRDIIFTLSTASQTARRAALGKTQ